MLCRLCLSSAGLINVFEKRDSLMISLKIMCLAKVQIHPDDGLPHSICEDCLRKLDESFQFKLQCEISDNKLRSLCVIPLDIDNINSDSQDSVNLEINESSILLDESSNKTNSCDVINNGENESDDRFINLFKVKMKTKKPLKTRNNKSEKNKKSSKIIQKQQCFTCGKVMSSRFRLKTHLQTHTGEKPYDCSDCGKKFSSQQNLKIHIRTHTGEKPYTCNTCGSTFAHSSGLSTHIRKHTGETPYQCSMCPRKFRTNGHLQYHLRRHTGEKEFECKICGCAFITSSDLKQHILKHTGEKRHVCSICGLRLSRASHLKRHMIVHNKTYSCNICDLKFTHKPLFDKHKKSHHDCEATLEESKDLT